MAHGGPSRATRRANAAIAQELVIDESWQRLVREIAVVTLVASAVWAGCTGLRWATHLPFERLFHEVLARGPLIGGGVLIGVMVLGGLARGLLLRFADFDQTTGDGVDVALENFHVTYDHLSNDPQPRYDRPSFLLALKKATMSVLTLGTGASGGLEGPVVLIGETLGAGFSRLVRTRDEYELRTYQMSGIAAAVGTLLGAPFTAALFATELVYTDRIVYRKFSFALYAALIAYVLNDRMLAFEPLFHAPPASAHHRLREYAQVAAVAVTVSLPVSVALGYTYRRVHSVTGRVAPVLRGAAGALLAALVALFAWLAFGLSPVHLLGMGEHTLQALLDGDLDPSLEQGWVLCAAVAGKMLTTGFTLQSGGSAGMLVPGMYIGGVSGAATYHGLVGLGLASGADPSMYVVAGIATSLVVLAGVPLAAMALVFEVFGREYGPPALLSCGLCYVLTQNLEFYAGQRRAPAVGDEARGRLRRFSEKLSAQARRATGRSTISPPK